MVDQTYIGNFFKGLTTDRLPFNIDNDAFPYMLDFYSWRGRAKRKRGTALLGQLRRNMQSSNSPNNWQIAKIGTLDGAGNFSGNLSTIFSFGLTASYVPESFTLSDGINTYTDNGAGILTGVPGGSGTINYATGAITITGGAAGQPLVGSFSYFPGLPVMGLRDFIVSPAAAEYPNLLAFDTKYSYEINETGTPVFYQTSFYKITQTPFTWSGADYQLFWTTNYSGALWATNNNPGMHFLTGTYVSGTGTPNVKFNFKNGGVNFTSLIVGDYVWFNEWSAATNLNKITGIVSDASDAVNGNYIVTFTVAEAAAGTGIVQLLTNSIPGVDGLKWYDGDPTNQNGIPAATGLGWVNFAPPLTNAAVSINNFPAGTYYLVGAQFIVSYKDRLVFFSPWVQTSSSSPKVILDGAIWSWNGTPYYTVDASGNPTLVPVNQTADPSAYFVDQTGKGGWLSAAIDQPILAVTNNEDVILTNFSNRSARFVYSGNDLYPFYFFLINSEFGSSSPLSSITLDRGGLCFGAKGLILTTQQSAQRIDLEIPDTIFATKNSNNGAYRVNAARDFFREWIYFAYPATGYKANFPTQTFLWNYRDQTWALLHENFTAHGTYRPFKSQTWGTLPYETWAQWTDPWNSGSAEALFPSIVAGNPQGYVLIKGVGTSEGNSGTIRAISNNGGSTQITSIDHCVEENDYLQINSCLGTTSINNQVGKVINYIDKDNFVIDLDFPAGTYGGLGKFIRMSQPLIQTKQFPFYWNIGRKARLCAQKYLMDTTANGQATVNIYLSQDPDVAWNDSVNTPFVPENALIYQQTLYTCPESTNIGLTAANTNLQQPAADTQFQIWHRLNTSLIGDTFQIGITLSDAQMRDFTIATSEITLHGMVLSHEPGPHLA